MIQFWQNIPIRFLSQQCYTEFFEKSNYSDAQCLKQTATTALGMLIMSSSLFLKVPQLIKISKSRSGEGINVKAVFMELFALTAGASYAYTNGYPFSAWGEGMFLGLQQVAMTAILLHYGGSTTSMLSFTAVYAALVATVAAKIIPLHILWFLQACNLPIMLSGKLAQCTTNYINKSTGQLSAATCALATLVCGARVLTTALVTRDRLMLALYSLAALGNALLLAQLHHYRNSTAANAITQTQSGTKCTARHSPLPSTRTVRPVRPEIEKRIDALLTPNLLNCNCDHFRHGQVDL